MIKSFIIGILLCAMTVVAVAQLAGKTGINNGPRFNKWDQFGMGLGGGYGSGSAPPSCSNSLDFTDACNSQYVGVL